MFICVLDYQNLDNPLFLKSFAETLKKVNPDKCVLIHSDSGYTDRIVQTGVMRDVAIIRSIQDLNHRLITFFADYGLACIGINGFQREIVTAQDYVDLQFDKKYINSLPNRTILVLSSMAIDRKNGQICAIPITDFIRSASDQLELSSIYVFSTDKNSHFIKNSSPELPRLALPDKNNQSDYPIGYPTDIYGLYRPHYLCIPIFNNNISKFDALCYLGYEVS
jgi:hypothetical protein